MKKLFLALAILIATATGFAVAPKAHAETTVKIASDNAYAPFEFQNNQKQWVGIDVELIQQVAKINHWKFEMTYPGFDAALQNLKGGQVDGVIAGMSITDERKQIFDFSEPYYTSALTMATLKTSKLKDYSELKGQDVGAKNGTAAQKWLQDNQKKYGFNIKTYKDGVNMYAALSSGNIIGAMDDSPVIGYAITQGQNLAMNLPVFSMPGGYGFAVQKGKNKELIDGFNKALTELKANGTYDKILKKYTGIASKSTDKKATKSADESTVAGILTNNWQQIGRGLLITLELAVISFVLAMLVGIIFGLFSVSPNGILRGISRVYVDLNRSIPLLVLTIFIFYGIPNLLQMITGHPSPLNEFTAGVLALTLNSSAYIAEIVRSGVQAVPAGQMEASRSLGLPYLTSMRKVILPQAIKITIPSLINQFIITLKDTTLVSVIGLIELLQVGQIIVARNYQAFRVYGLIGVIYMIVLLLLMWVGRRVEKKMK